MKKRILAGILLAAGSLLAGERFYVSPRGSDAGPGSRWRPFATIPRAQEAVKAAKAAGASEVEVRIRAGRYELSEPLVISAENGGCEKCRVVYRAAGEEMPVLSGGRIISDWKVGPDGVWETVLPDVKEGKWYFTQLFVNGERRFRPRLPRKGWFNSIDNFERVEKQGVRGLVFEPGDLSDRWENLQDIELLTLHVWSPSRMRIGEFASGTNAVRFTTLLPIDAYWMNYKKRRYTAENVKEAFGEPGDFYLDRKTGVLVYKPLPGENPADVTVTAPVLDQVLIVKDVRNTVLEGVAFELTNWVTPKEGNVCPQAEMNIPAGVEIVRTEGLTIRGCSFERFGGYAIAFGPGTHDSELSGCVLRDLGAGGVKIGPPYVGYSQGRNEAVMIGEKERARAESTSRITVRDCVLNGGGRIHPAAHGVWIGRSSFNRILRCEITDFYYTAVSIGWNWGYAPSQANYNEVAFNHMAYIGQGILSDMGGVYTLGISPGTRVHDNLIHDVDAYDYGGWGLYTDEGSTGIEFRNNLVYRVKTGGFHQHYGEGNVVENNIFAYSKTQQLQRTRDEKHISFFFRKNIVYWDNNSPLFGSNWNGADVGVQTNGAPLERFVLKNNLYWSVGATNNLFPKNRTLDEWRDQTGQDVGSFCEDPQFVLPKEGDFRFKNLDVVKKIGFEPFDVVSTTGPAKTVRLPPYSRKRVPTMYE